jgi:hypothetical protein
MENNTTSTTVTIPSSVGMPACSHASLRTTGAVLGATAGLTVRERGDVQTGAKGVMGFLPVERTNGFAIAYPGSPAWRPPTS